MLNFECDKVLRELIIKVRDEIGRDWVILEFKFSLFFTVLLCVFILSGLKTILDVVKGEKCILMTDMQNTTIVEATTHRMIFYVKTSVDAMREEVQICSI